MAEHVLWGSHPKYADGVPIKITGGTMSDCEREKRWREKDGGWTDLEIKPAPRRQTVTFYNPAADKQVRCDVRLRTSVGRV